MLFYFQKSHDGDHARWQACSFPINIWLAKELSAPWLMVSGDCVCVLGEAGWHPCSWQGLIQRSWVSLCRLWLVSRLLVCLHPWVLIWHPRLPPLQFSGGELSVRFETQSPSITQVFYHSIRPIHYRENEMVLWKEHIMRGVREQKEKGHFRFPFVVCACKSILQIPLSSRVLTNSQYKVFFFTQDVYHTVGEVLALTKNWRSSFSWSSYFECQPPPRGSWV